MKTWIIPVRVDDGRNLYVSVKARTQLGACWSFFFDDTVEDGDIMNTAIPTGRPVELDEWLARETANAIQRRREVY